MIYENNITSLKVIKQWEGDNESVRPNEISVDLLSNNVVYDTVILNEGNSWTYTWDNLNSNKIWEIRESEVPVGYKCSYQKDGNTVIITNYKGEPPISNTSLNVLKVWNDDGNAEGCRPDEIEVYLLCDGEYVDTAILSEDNNWRYSWNGLDENMEYGVVEAYVSENYESQVTRVGSTFVIENTFIGGENPDEPEPPTIGTTRIVVNKVWNNDDETVRPDTISIDLLRDGMLYDTVELSELSNWRYSWNDLDDISTWSVKESAVPEGYSVSYSKTDSEHITVTNTYSSDEGYGVIMPSTGGSLNRWIGLYSIFGVCLILALVVYKRSNRCKL